MKERDEKGRFMSTEVSKEESTEYGFYSKLLNKPFDTLAELKEAEALVKKEEEEKRLKVEGKRAEANEVKEAITARLTTEAEARKTKKEAYEVYLKACDEADKLVNAAKAIEKEKLNDFCSKYGAFHDSITIGDVTYTCDYTNKPTYLDPFKRIWDSFGF